MFAVWSGSEVILWGGTNTFDWLADGAAYSGDTWSAIEPSGAPLFRESGSAAWTGNRMLIWGGWDGGNYLDSGALFDPVVAAAGEWTDMSTDNAPGGRAEHATVWTGDELFIWGGCRGAGCTSLLNTGGRWSEAGGWTPVPADPAVDARTSHTAVWTGQDAIIFGGRGAGGVLGDGARTALQ